MTGNQQAMFKDLGGLAVFMVAILLVYYIFSSDPKVPKEIDSTGYVSHKVESTITADPNWIIGESRTCISNPLDSLNAKELNKPFAYALWGLQCGDGDWHRITITFWGSAVQVGKKAAYWNCVRTSDSFTCKQTTAY
jgi:hypothetical protein